MKYLADHQRNLGSTQTWLNITRVRLMVGRMILNHVAGVQFSYAGPNDLSILKGEAATARGGAGLLTQAKVWGCQALQIFLPLS